jgi:hypothetical protein
VKTPVTSLALWISEARESPGRADLGRALEARGGMFIAASSLTERQNRLARSQNDLNFR